MPEPIEVISTEKIIVATADGIISATVGEVDLKLPIAIARYLALEILRNTFLYHQAAVDTAWANRESA
jgi:hypothetical protein